MRLWPSKVENGVREMLAARFPKVRIVQGAEALKQAFEECDFLLHGSGPSLVAEENIVKWSKAAGKPYGVYCMTFSTTSKRGGEGKLAPILLPPRRTHGER